MKAVPSRPSSDEGEPHSVSWSPAGMVYTGTSLTEPQRPPPPAANEAGKDWERVRAGGPADIENASSDECIGGVRVGEVVVVVVRWPAEPIQQDVKGWKVEMVI